jgi:hypothetical protein
MLEKSQVKPPDVSNTNGVLGTKSKPLDESIDSAHAMIEHSSNSMVNMAISLDPLTAAQVLPKVEKDRLEQQKKAIKEAA